MLGKNDKIDGPPDASKKYVYANFPKDPYEIMFNIFD